MEVVRTTEYGQITEDRSSGNGYWRFEPDPLVDLASRSDSPDEPNYLFAELPAILAQAETQQSLLVRGAPGSGKTNLLYDIESYCAQVGVPSLRVAIHINASKLTTRAHTAEVLEEFSQTEARKKRVLILDNADYVAYKGHRSRPRAEAYATHVVPLMLQAMDVPGTIAIGTAHTVDWQQNHWTWYDRMIDVPQAELVANFNSQAVFEGRLTTNGLRSVVWARTRGDPSRSESVIALLMHYNAPYHIAQHVDYERLEIDPDGALAEVEAGRQLRIGAKQ